MPVRRRRDARRGDAHGRATSRIHRLLCGLARVAACSVNDGDRMACGHRRGTAVADMGPKSSTPNGDPLDVLATLIDAYEALHQSTDPSDPIEAIRFRGGHACGWMTVRQ